MSQIFSSSEVLTDEQLSYCIQNFATIRHFTKVEKIFEGKGNYSENNINKLKNLGIDPEIVTRFPIRYMIYKLSHVEKSKSCETLEKFNSKIKIKNINDRTEFLIIIDNNRFDKQNFLALLSLYPIIHEMLSKQKGFELYTKLDEDYIQKGNEVYVTVSTTFHIEPSLIRHLKTRFLPCNYRIFSMHNAYPLIGCKYKTWCGMCQDFEVLEYEKLYNNQKYSVIYNDEILVDILNANVGDLIICKTIFNEGRPYFEYTLREVYSRNNEVVN